MNISASIVDVIVQKMPRGTEKCLTKHSDDGFELIIHWKLSDDNERPRKYSKVLIIDAPKELIEYVSTSPDHIRRDVLLSISDFVSSKLAAFDPNHDSPRGSAKPVESWSLSMKNLFEDN